MDFDNNTPIYLQIIDLITQDIINGKYSFGDKIPSIRELAAIFAVNQNTILHSYKELELMGLIETRRGLGYFVSSKEDAIDKLKREKLNELIQKFIQDMSQLGYSKDEIIQHIKEGTNA